MVKVKICGLRQEQEIEFINKALPEYAGFVFAPSKRHVEPKEAASFIKKMNPSIEPVGVFMDQRIRYIAEAAKACRLTVIQLHGDEDADDIQSLRRSLSHGTQIWKALKMSDKLLGNKQLLASRIAAYSGVCDMILLDSAAPGGGKAFDYRLIPSFPREFVLAGGLTPETVKEAIQKLHPAVVDVSSGVEGLDGYKDEERIKAFIKAVKEANL